MVQDFWTINSRGLEKARWWWKNPFFWKWKNAEKGDWHPGWEGSSKLCFKHILLMEPQKIDGSGRCFSFFLGGGFQVAAG